MIVLVQEDAARPAVIHSLELGAVEPLRFDLDDRRALFVCCSFFFCVFSGDFGSLELGDDGKRQAGQAAAETAFEKGAKERGVRDGNARKRKRLEQELFII